MIEPVHRLFEAKTDTEAIQRALRKAIDDRGVEDTRELAARRLGARGVTSTMTGPLDTTPP